MGRDSKNEKRGDKFVRLPNSLIDTPAWISLSCFARSVHILLIRRHNGRNNGAIYLPSREAAKALSVDRKTVLRSIKELEQAGFITKTKAALLGFEGKGRSAEWRLTHLPHNGKAPTRCSLKI